MIKGKLTTINDLIVIKKLPPQHRRCRGGSCLINYKWMKKLFVFDFIR